MLLGFLQVISVPIFRLIRRLELEIMSLVSGDREFEVRRQGVWGVETVCLTYGDKEFCVWGRGVF